jgi:DNA-binding transcriptional LysR family regulator
MIKQIENDLGVMLFERTKRAVIVTSAGMELLRDAKQMVLQMETVKKRLTIHGKGETGTLKIGYVGAVMHSDLPMLYLPSLKVSHINLQFEEQPNHSLLHGLNNRDFRCCLCKKHGCIRKPCRKN